MNAAVAAVFFSLLPLVAAVPGGDACQVAASAVPTPGLPELVMGTKEIPVPDEVRLTQAQIRSLARQDTQARRALEEIESRFQKLPAGPGRAAQEGLAEQPLPERVTQLLAGASREQAFLIDCASASEFALAIDETPRGCALCLAVRRGMEAKFQWRPGELAKLAPAQEQEAAELAALREEVRRNWAAAVRTELKPAQLARLREAQMRWLQQTLRGPVASGLRSLGGRTYADLAAPGCVFASISYVAHEWGTFTSMQDSGGLTLEGLQHEEEGLPDFVYSRSKVRACPLREYGYKGLEVDVVHVTKKMETPVVYFYAEQPLHVRARVEFERGLLTQWYPVSDLLGPPELRPEDGPLDMAGVERSFLEWGIEVLGKGAGLERLRGVAPGTPWEAQRIPDSNVVRTDAREAPRRGPQEFEKFLFYRGLGRFELPLEARTLDSAHVSLTNRGARTVEHLFLLNVRDGKAAWSYAPQVQAGATVALAAEFAQPAQGVEQMIAGLRPALEAKLVETGLYPKEAQAMTTTWERSYFHTPGLRILYLVPREELESVLPMVLDPAPRELVRVLVGRLECLTPDEEAEVTAAVRDWSSPDAAVRAHSAARLERLGRFVEPHMRRVLAHSRDEAVLANARAILAGGANRKE